MVADHCNGLLLCGDREHDYVVNPATRRWARLPQRPPPHVPGFGQSAHLAFDPAVSPHYEVFVIPRLRAAGESDFDGESEKDDALLESEWPPASYSLHVFSSTVDRWDERTFLREGEAAGIVADMGSAGRSDRYHAVYWRSNLYIHCEHGYLTRMSLTNHTYRVIRLPGADELIEYCPSYNLGRSLRGVYCAKNSYQNRLQLWHLDESSDQTEWVLNHDGDLEPFARRFDAHYCKVMSKGDHAQQMDGPWILQDVNYRRDFEGYSHGGNRKYGALVEEKYGWNSDEDNVLDIEDAAEEGYGRQYDFLAFHPYKDVVFLELDRLRGVTYDWRSSRFQVLGSIEPQEYQYGVQGIDASFPYTPCWMGEFPGNELETLLEEEEISRKELELEAQFEDNSNFTCVDYC